MSTRVIEGLLLDFEGKPLKNHKVVLELIDGSYTAEAFYVSDNKTYYTDGEGQLKVTLWANEEGEQASFYRLQVGRENFLFTLAPGNSPLTWSQVRQLGVTESDPQYKTLVSYVNRLIEQAQFQGIDISQFTTETQLTDSFVAHRQEPNPHPQYEVPPGVTNWEDLQNKPESFTPSIHSHPIGEVDGLQIQLQGRELEGVASSLLTSHIEDQDPHPAYQLLSDRGIPNGYAFLDETARITFEQLPETLSNEPVDSSPSEPEPEPLPPVEENQPEPDPVEPIIIPDDVFFYDPSSYSPSRKPRLSAAGSPDYFPAAVVGNLSGQSRYHGIVFANIQETMAFRRVEVPLRRANVAGGELASLLFLRKEGNFWVMRMKREVTLVQNHARIVWAREFIFPRGETWAVVTGLRGGLPKLSIFYGDASPYPAPAANATLSSNDLLQQDVNISVPVTEGAGTHRCIRFYGVNVPKDVIGPVSPEDLPPGLGSSSRETISHTTALVNQNGFVNFSLALQAVAVLLNVTLSHAARLRCYRTTEARTLDANRVIGAPTDDGVTQDLLFEVVLPFYGSLSINLVSTLLTLGGDGMAYFRLDNRHTATTAYTANFNLLSLEPKA